MTSSATTRWRVISTGDEANDAGARAAATAWLKATARAFPE
jgi:hypothetical protein